MLETEPLSPTWEVITIRLAAIISMSSPYFTAKVLMPPAFEPNQWLYTTHADKGESEADVYAWAVRDIISRMTGLPKDEEKMPELYEYRKRYGDNLNSSV